MPLANILLTFVIRELIKKDESFKLMFEENLKIWKRFIDDCFGMFMGSERKFKKFYKKLADQFREYGLELTLEQSRKEIIMLDMIIFIYNNLLHTKENRKETAANLYLRYTSSHPSYTFKGIVKSQMYRLRRLCSRQEDYETALENLKMRCINSGYEKEMVEGILEQAGDLQRDLTRKINVVNEETYKIRWITMAHSKEEKEIDNFVKNINTAMRSHSVGFEVIKTTAPTLGKELFNNNNSDVIASMEDCSARCEVCKQNARGDRSTVTSKATGDSYKIDKRMTCNDSGIYLVSCKCEEQYAGKTTVTTGKRYKEHWKKKTSVKEHMEKCDSKPTAGDVKVQFLENMWNRGKYSLSEREYLWNRRLKGSINVQKTLRTHR